MEKTITYFYNGTRTTASLSEYEKKVFDALAKREGLPRTVYAEKILKDTKCVNRSVYLRDFLMKQLVELSKLEVVE